MDIAIPTEVLETEDGVSRVDGLVGALACEFRELRVELVSSWELAFLGGGSKVGVAHDERSERSLFLGFVGITSYFLEFQVAGD